VDIAKVAPEVVAGCFVNSGQVCVATKRVYVHASIYVEFLQAMVEATEKLTVGNPHDGTATLGPIQNQMQYERVKTFFDDSSSNGYRFATGKKAVESTKGYFIKPAIVDNPPEDSMIVAQEQFGILAIWPSHYLY
jgi:acyl-CoA reductase-like NAD-dependent aldehyde dehydrogenase